MIALGIVMEILFCWCVSSFLLGFQTKKIGVESPTRPSVFLFCFSSSCLAISLQNKGLSIWIRAGKAL